LIASQPPIAPPPELNQGNGAALTACFRGVTRRSRFASVAVIGKGGAGKSSLATCLAVFASQVGLKAAIIDADPQGSAVAWRRRRSPGDIAVRACCVEDIGRTVDLARKCGVEVLFIDMPPGLRQALDVVGVCDLALIPMRPTLFDAEVTLNLVPLLKSSRRRYGVVINAAPPPRDGLESPMVREAREALCDIGRHLWAKQITHRLAIPYAAMRGIGVSEAHAAPQATAEFEALWQSICATLKIEATSHDDP
jgi:chromosome partitioning protein